MEGSNNDGNYVIIDNDKLVWKNCLTFIYNTEYCRVRYRFYDKFVQSIKSPFVIGKIGSHIAHWLYNQNEQLMNSINNCFDTDLLQEEIMFYKDYNAVNEDYINKHFNHLITRFNILKSD